MSVPIEGENKQKNSVYFMWQTIFVYAYIKLIRSWFYYQYILEIQGKII